VIGNNASLFNYPISIAFDNQLNLYVSDYENHRIQKFLRYWWTMFVDVLLNLILNKKKNNNEFSAGNVKW